MKKVIRMAWQLAAYCGLLFSIVLITSCADETRFYYKVSFPDPANHCFTVELHINHPDRDTLLLTLPDWMPGYYQLMDYSNDLESIRAEDERGEGLDLWAVDENTWSVATCNEKEIMISYTVRTHREFVANNYVDEDHAYIVPPNTFLYQVGALGLPVELEVVLPEEWTEIATGLKPVAELQGHFVANGFDELYDCPILAGALEELPSFYIEGVEHRFMAYRPGEFDRALFMERLEKVVRASVDIIGEIPYEQYTFIGIGPGRGGIEHLNNTTVGFDGSRMKSEQSMTGVLEFLAHEYFHHYNVKRIRPFELGPFDYNMGSRTNLLWISEGITVYYEARILKDAGLFDAQSFLDHHCAEINRLQNDPGRSYQSLAQASYFTWEEGPFGNFGKGPDRSISVYNKGAVVGLLLDLELRHRTRNKNSLDDVMRMLYRKYYKEKNRGFTDAEFQFACEQVAGGSLKELFEYVYTTKEIDYNKYLGYAGLELKTTIQENRPDQMQYMVTPMDQRGVQEEELFRFWIGE